jgi:hypothetical protein
MSYVFPTLIAMGFAYAISEMPPTVEPKSYIWDS